MIAQMTCRALAKGAQIPLPALLGLEPEARSDRGINNRFFYASPLTTQRLAILNNMVGSRSLVIVVIGERGSGKTTLMNRFIHDAGKRWRAGRVRLKRFKAPCPEELRNLHNRLVFLSHKDTPPSVMVDDAHQLTSAELKLLIKSAYNSEGQRKIQSIVLFAEPDMRSRFAEIAQWLPPTAVIDKIFMAALTEKQTADYLEHRIKAAGFLKKLPFSDDQIRTIHRISKGKPGWINGEAFIQLKRICGVDRGAVMDSLRRWRLPAAPRFRWFNRLHAFARN